MSLNVIGLVSGGKDSLFSLAHCLQNGHKLIALANLYPNSLNAGSSQEHGVEEPDLDSFMYQTVGHSIIPLYEEAIGVPLYRRPITGSAVQNGRYYEAGSRMKVDDETEDMYALVEEVLKHHPTINALSAGAILSTYQRTRVESVAVRLGLVPLAYLWQYPALPPPFPRKDSLTGLLDDMKLSGCDARIIKIASGGIHANMGFSDVTDSSTRTQLVSGMTPFFLEDGQESWLRGAVLGEGGEYETLALDGPGSLWKKRIHVASHETYEAGGGAVYVRLGKASLVERSADHIGSVPIPVLLDERFAALQSRLTASTATHMLSRSLKPTLISDFELVDLLDLSSNWNKSSNTIQIFNLICAGSTAAEQLDRIIATLPGVLSTVTRLYKMEELSLRAENLVSATLLLQSMQDFASVNQIYTTKLWPVGLSNPPARVTVAASLPRDARVSLSLIYNMVGEGTESRKGLHVQSRSYWAPANIGPYSQAICVPAFQSGLPEVVHLAGQIPLVPATMAMLDACFVDQAVLALQHLWRVAQERCVDQWAGAGIAFLAHADTSTQDDTMMRRRAQEAARVWQMSHQINEKGHETHKESSLTEAEMEADVDEEDEYEDIDIWDLQQRSRGFGMTSHTMTVGEHLHKLPNKVVHPRPEVPCFIAAQVLSLPRNAPIEWWSTGIAGLVSMSGAQTAKVSAVLRVSTHSWALSGISIGEIDSEKADTAEAEVAEFDQSETISNGRRLCLIVTLLINSTVDNEDMQHLPHTLDRLAPYLLPNQEDRDNIAFELATAHSFINLSSPMAFALQEKVQLLQQSCTILCKHVWSSGSEQSGSSNMSEASVRTEAEVERTAKGDSAHSAGQSNDEVTEIAAAIVMRIDAFSK